jgi:hypothetical protein
MPYHFSQSATSLDAEIGRQVDDPTRPRSSNSRRCCIAMPFGVAKNTTSQSAQRASLGSLNCRPTAAAQAGEHVGHGGAGFATRRDSRQFDLGMARQQAQQFDTCVARAADDTCLDHCKLLDWNQ